MMYPEKLAAVVFASLLFGGFSGTATAAIIIETGNNPQPGENVHLKSRMSDNARTVQGLTNKTNAVVRFSGAGENLTTPSKGQARIEAQDGSTFNALTIAPDRAGFSFTSLILNLDAAGDGRVVFTINPLVGAPTVQTLALDRNGQNFFTILAQGGQRMSSVELDTTVGLDDVRQVRIGGLSLGGVPAVPEPASLGLMALGSLALLARRRAV
ncbi:MAG TPA: PEP-CTERM sorting domain-containing protein [Tepidisphaeraceae bacterium]|jgi:hypothetical protein